MNNKTIFLLLFLIICSFGTLKVYITPEAYWLLLIILFSLYLIKNLINPNKKLTYNLTHNALRTIYPWLIGWFLLISSIFITDLLFSQNNITSIAKYTLIALIAALAFKTSDIDPLILEYALLISLIINTAIITINILLKNYDFLVILGDGRIGWLANWPGKLWYVAGFIFPLIIFRIFSTSLKLFWFYLVCALLLFALDGSRTGYLWFIVSLLIIFSFNLLTQQNKKIIIAKFVAIIIISGGIFTIIQPAILYWLNDKTHLDTNPTSSSLLRTIEGDNHTRINMIYTALEHSYKNFPLGSGFQTTKSQEKDGSYAVVHIAYIQTLADIGIMGFLGFMLIVFYPIYRVIAYSLQNKRFIKPFIKDTVTPLSIVSLCALSFLFHPISNELTEWGILIIAAVIVFQRISINEKIAKK